MCLFATARRIEFADIVGAHLEGVASGDVGKLAAGKVAHREAADVVLVICHRHRAGLVVEVHNDTVGCSFWA